MKKFLVVLMLAVLTFSLCACSYVPTTRFMSTAKVNSLAKKFENPQAQVTLNYTAKNGTEMEAVIVYDLLLTQTPLATIRFIQLVNDEFYDGTFIDAYVSSLHYVKFGKYTCTSEDQKSTSVKYYQNPCDVTFKGEFKSNDYKEPKDGYAQFKMMSLAMYHDDYTEDNNNFDSANGYIMMTLSTTNIPNFENYAVFAEMNSITLKRGDNEPIGPLSKVPEDLRANLSQTGTTSQKVYTDSTEENYSTISLMSTLVKVKIELLGDYDWSKLPTVR